MEPIEYRAVMRLLYLEGSFRGGGRMTSYDIAKHWHRPFKCGRTLVETFPEHSLSAIDDAAIKQMETAIFDDRRVTERQLAHEVKRGGYAVCSNF